MKEEKKCLDEIKELKRSKPKVSKVKAEMEGKKPGANTEGLRKNIQKQPSDIKETKEQKRLISAEYAKLDEERQKQMAEMPKLLEEASVLKVRAEKAAEARLERQAEFDERRRQRQGDQLDDQPHVAETTSTEQTTAWCRSIFPK